MSDETVYLLWHYDKFEGEILIGVYQSSLDAEAAIERVKNKPGFCEEGGEFEVVPYVLNRDHWTEGFHRPTE